MSDRSNRASLQGVVFIVRIYEGILPFVRRIVGWHPNLSFPTRVDAPWWWLVSGASAIAGLAVTAAIDRVGVKPRNVNP